jgi:hypothetical protein
MEPQTAGRQRCDNQREADGKQDDILQQKLLQRRRDDRETERAYLRDPGCAKDERRRQ